jgi:NAD(P)H dehydrogenase (quinone)
MIVVTGATGKLGHHVIHELMKRVPAPQVVAAVRNIEKASDFAGLGIQLRHADYAKPETLAAAFAGAEKVLLISSNEVGQRVAQHKAVIDACITANVKLLAYTSVLRADTSTLGLAAEHLATEELIRRAGLPFVFLRNSWYLENHTEALGPALQHGVIPECSKGWKVCLCDTGGLCGLSCSRTCGAGT